jgi:ABC-type multidrug transport system fused ATPase/permease subunit
MRTVWAWLTQRRKVQLVLLGVLSLVGGVAELATLGAVLPFLALLAKPAGALAYPVVGFVVSALGWTDGVGLIVAVTVIFGMVVLIAAATRLLVAWASLRFAQALGHDLAMRVYGRTLQQPYSFHVSRNSSELLASVTKVDSVVNGAVYPTIDLLVASLTTLIILGGLLAIDWMLALLAAVLFGSVYWILSHLSRDRVVRNSRIIAANASARIQGMQEGLGGIRDILLDGSAPLHLRRFQHFDWTLRGALVKNNLWGQMPRYMVEAMGVGIIAGLAVFSSHRFGSLADALPVLGALSLGTQKLLPLFQRMYQGWNSIAGSQGNLEDVARFADATVPSGVEVRGDLTRLPFKEAVHLVRVGFRYSDDAPWVFRGLDLTVEKGARIGFVGETGCGKSTLLDLVMGLLAPSEGHLEVDGVVLTSENLRHWQARIAHVPQSIFLADATLAANIALGEPPERIDMARVEAAAKRARIHAFVSGLDEGYRTTVGERGVRLSGGQRQRVGIARALYREADVLVLDEATSALDGETEASVMEGIEEVGEDVTVLIVAHRLSTLKGCDRVIQMGQALQPKVAESESVLQGNGAR